MPGGGVREGGGQGGCSFVMGDVMDSELSDCIEEHSIILAFATKNQAPFHFFPMFLYSDDSQRMHLLVAL